MAFAGTYAKFKDGVFAHRGEEEDIEDNESDTTKVSLTAESFDKAHLLPFRGNLNPSDSSLAQTRAAKRAKERDNFWTWLRWGVIIGLQTILILLLSVNHGQNKNTWDTEEDSTASDTTVETGSDINGLYKTCKYQHFSYGASELF